MKSSKIKPKASQSVDEKKIIPHTFDPPPGVQSARNVLRRILQRGQMRFAAPSGVSQENRSNLADTVQQLIGLTKTDYMARKWMGSSTDVWTDYTLYIKTAVDFFRPRIFLPTDCADRGQSVTAYMCSYSTDLTRDLERVNRLLILAQLIVWKNVTAQQYVSQCQTDLQLLRLYEMCLRACARSNDSDPNDMNMNQINSTIVNTSKQLLISIMRLFNVLIDNNPGRLLNLWLDLFAREKHEHLGVSAIYEETAWGASARERCGQYLATTGGDQSPPNLPLPSPMDLQRIVIALRIAHAPMLDRERHSFSEDYKVVQGIVAPVLALVETLQNEFNERDGKIYSGYLDGTPASSPPFAIGFPQGITHILKLNISRCESDTIPLPLEMRERALYNAKKYLIEDLQINVSGLEDEDETGEPTAAQKSVDDHWKKTHRMDFSHTVFKSKGLGPPERIITTGDSNGSKATTTAVRPPDLDPERARAVALAIAAESEASNVFAHEPYLGDQDDDEALEEEDDEDDEVEESEDEGDYEDDEDERDPYGEAFKSRGIISELPLILGPNEIVPLPQILAAGVCLENGRKEQELIDRILKACQCHLLVMQDTGRHILREMLIFIAAWDLNEDEDVYKIMSAVMESVLRHGMMPLAWESFKESKDIVSPAQSILVKTLTHIFRKRKKVDNDHLNASPLQQPPLQQPPLQQPPLHTPVTVPEQFAFDKTMIEKLLHDFRNDVVPQTIALIWLQGQIRKRVCVPDDFPLNLWDMERVYEGVYQFLELFAVLTETQLWKEMLIKHHLSFELVALLRELEESIPKRSVNEEPLELQVPMNPMPPPPKPSETQTELQEDSTVSGTPGAVPIAVERPYDPIPSGVVTNEPPAVLSPQAPLSPDEETIEDAQEASEFEWRNLKKLVVLVLSSLAYKSTVVKNQVKELGGVELVMKCFEFDEHNPYLREHAVLCLNFLLEKGPENSAEVTEDTVANTSTVD